MDDVQAHLESLEDMIATMKSRLQAQRDDQPLVVINASCGRGGQKSESFEDKEIMHVGFHPGGRITDIANKKVVAQTMATLKESPNILPYYPSGAYGVDGNKFKGIYDIVGEPEEVTDMKGWNKWMDVDHLNGLQFNGGNSMTDEEAEDWFRGGGIGIYFRVKRISDIEISLDDGKKLGIPYLKRFCASRKCMFNKEIDEVVSRHGK